MSGPAPWVITPSSSEHGTDSAATARKMLRAAVGDSCLGDPRPVRVDTTAALAASYPRHFPGVQLQTPGWLRLRCAWYRLIPLLVVVLGAIWLALGAIWLALVLWQARGP